MRMREHKNKIIITEGIHTHKGKLWKLKQGWTKENVKKFERQLSVLLLNMHHTSWKCPEHLRKKWKCENITKGWQENIWRKIYNKYILSKNFITTNVGPRLSTSRKVLALSFPLLNARMVRPWKLTIKRKSLIQK